MTIFEPVEVALRCYPDSGSRRKGRSTVEHEKIPDRILVFDTETTVDQYQNLLFGSYYIFEHGRFKYRGIFYGDTIKDTDLNTLKQYCEENGIRLMSRADFVGKVFYPEVYYLKTLCVGFNLPFDISRIAIHYGNARGHNKGGFSFQLSKDRTLPRVVVKHLDSKRAFIQFTKSFSRKRGNRRRRRGKSNRFRGHFLDLKTFSFALTNVNFSLDGACKHFNTEIVKSSTSEHGKINRKYIEYNLKDVESTFSLYQRLIVEYGKYHLDLPPTRIYSPASIGKAYFEQMGIRPFLEKNPDFPKGLLGNLMSTYYGGRSEVRIRKTPTKVVLIDFLSMYPTMFILLDLWKLVISKEMLHFDDTDNVKEFVHNASLDTFSDPQNWKKLLSIVQIVPDGDILPVRGKYGSKHTYNIGLNHLTSDNPLWYTLADVVASKILTGKSPRILKAIRFTPKGVQDGLRPVEIVGGRSLDPIREDFFKALMEYRHKAKQEGKDAVQKIVKIITNSTSYGIFVEVNTSERNEAKVKVYGHEDKPFSDVKDKVEAFGKEFNPIIATMITSASRLVLALSEAILEAKRDTYAFCDTDSLAIPPHRVEDIQGYFQKLSPYSFPDKIFKMEDENFGEDGTYETLWFYGISAKRYVLYNMHGGISHIRKHSLHGLGHILNPYTHTHDIWHARIWVDILRVHYGMAIHSDIHDTYASMYAVSRMSVTSPHVLSRFKVVNRDKPYHKQIKPFNFILVGITNATDDRGNPIKPMAPFSKLPQSIVYGDFIDYHSGKTLNGHKYWKSMDTTFWDYIRHPEAKFTGDAGVLERRHLSSKAIINIGKESDKLDETELLGVSDSSYQVYSQSNNGMKLTEFILHADETVIFRSGISVKQWTRWIRTIQSNLPLKIHRGSMKRLRRAMNRFHSLVN